MSIRVDLGKRNMDKVMWVVREFDINPSEAINLLLEDKTVNDAWSKYDERKENKEEFACKKW